MRFLYGSNSDSGARETTTRVTSRCGKCQFAVKMIGQIGAAFAALFPARTEHEMINNQLAAALEQIGQSLFSLWAIKDILLLDLGHREFAPCRTKRVALARELLFPRQQILPSDQPLTFRHDLCLFVCYFHFFLLQFHLFDVFDWLNKILFIANAVRPPV